MARFTNPDVQKKIEELSQRSRGQVSAAKAEHVTSDFAGSFKLAERRADAFPRSPSTSPAPSSVSRARTG